ncbi:hypothetical protein BJX70DRAFT_400238 [Aspergillus crustosus]
MSLGNLPTELLLNIGDEMTSEVDLAALCAVTHRFNAIYQPYLIKNNIRHNRSSGLSWATWHNNIALATKFLHRGANPNRRALMAITSSDKKLRHEFNPDGDTVSRQRHWRREYTATETPIVIAVKRGHREMAVLLAGYGARITSALVYVAERRKFVCLTNELRRMGVGYRLSR